MLAGTVMVALVGGAMILTGAMRVGGFALHGLDGANKGLLWLRRIVKGERLHVFVHDNRAAIGR
jgi:hypothetical protein